MRSASTQLEGKYSLKKDLDDDERGKDYIRRQLANTEKGMKEGNQSAQFSNLRLG